MVKKFIFLILQIEIIRDDKNNDDAINYTHFCGYYCVPDNKYIHKNLA